MELSPYRVEKSFDELVRGEVEVYCYESGDRHKFSRRINIMENGDNEWYKNFISAHSWLSDNNYTLIDNDSHIFCKYFYYDYDKHQSICGLTILHKSTNPYLFFKYSKRRMVLIKDHNSF